MGVVNAYINSEMHLILVLSNGSEIDAGYVGTNATKSYTVTFKDYNGAVLKTENVYENESARRIRISSPLRAFCTGIAPIRR